MTDVRVLPYERQKEARKELHFDLQHGVPGEWACRLQGRAPLC